MSTDTQPDGTVERHDDGRVTLRYERRLAHPLARVWAAITEPDELARWLGAADYDLRPGGAVVLRWLNTDLEGNAAVLHGTISALEPPRLLEIMGDIHGTLRWELRADGADATQLTFSSTMAEPEGEMLPMTLAGWHVHLDHLAGALEGETVHWPRWYELHYPAWQVHFARYGGARSD
jgi:uncharacterized protein YndB with AHSA1/START domain